MRLEMRGWAHLFLSISLHFRCGVMRFLCSIPFSVSKPLTDPREEPTVFGNPELGYSAAPQLTLEQRLKIGASVEHILSTEKEAARAPPRE